MKLQQNCILLNFIVKQEIFRMFAGSIRSQKPLWWGGTSGMTAQGLPLCRSHIVRIRRIPMPIPSRSSSGSEITTEGIPTFPWENFTASCGRTRRIPVIPARCIEYSSALDSVKKQNLQRKSHCTISLMIPPRWSVSSGKWMLNSSPRPVT